MARIGWFPTLDPALAIAITDRDFQIDLLIVSPGTLEATAHHAMRQAADPTNTVRAPGIVAALTAVSGSAPPDEQNRASAWENEGGRPGSEVALVG